MLNTVAAIQSSSQVPPLLTLLPSSCPDIPFRAPLLRLLPAPSTELKTCDIYTLHTPNRIIMSHPDTPPKEKESSWSSRLPLANTPLPSFRPNMSGLRTALLGYLGEVERAIQGQEEQQQQQYVEEPKEFGGTSSESTGLSSDEMDEEGRSTAIASGSKDGLRQRAALGVTGNGPAPIGNPTALQETNRSLLNHLSALREDVRSYLQPKLSVPPISYPSMPNRDWLRSLPSKLSLVDIGVDSPLSPEAKGKGRMPDFDTGAVENARKRVLETVRTLLPSEEWAGWERLGWEDQEDDGESPFRGRRRAASASIHRNPTYNEEEEEEDEPEYLFPNRTPASQQAMARAARRQAIRSTSFNGALHAREDRIVETSPIRPGFISAPMTRRTTGLPSFGQVALESEDDLDATAVHDQLEIEEMKQLLEQELEDVGPSIAEALQRAEDGNKLITYDDLPFWWRNNEHIITG
jgi:adiponectin receptor